AWTGKINTVEDVLYRSLVPLLKTTRIIVDFNIKVPMPGGSQLDVLTPVKKANNKFNVVDVESVFNNNLDPDCYNNLLSSYNSVTGIATLSTAVPVGQIAYCRLVLQPQVAVKNTSMDFIEAELAPSIQLTDIMSVETQPTAHEIGVTNKATKAVLRVQPPYRFNLRFTMIALAPGGVDLTRTLEALVELMEENPLLTSAATGEQYRLWLIEEFQDTTQPNDMNLHSMQATFEVLNILTFKKPTVSEVAVGTLNLNTSNG
ncbi:MAG: hypothetical protein KGI50_08270, partial [Patescibacteria group bacterium]|nr:hypothetical protein [Patescibacteria group bacterium]